MYPRLLPRKLSKDQESLPEGTIASHTAGGSHSIAHGSAARGTKNISSACTACKKRKSKCTGEPAPCLTCRQAKTDCVFDQSKDKRRKHNRGSGQELQSFKIILEGFFTSVRWSQEPQLQELVSLILSNPSRRQLIDFIESSSGQLLRRSVINDEEFSMLQRAGEEVLDLSDDSPARYQPTDRYRETTAHSSASSSVEMSGQHESGETDAEFYGVHKALNLPSLETQMSSLSDNVRLPRLRNLPYDPVFDSGSIRPSNTNDPAPFSSSQRLHLYDDIWSQLERLRVAFKGKRSTLQQPSQLPQYPESGSVDHLCLPPLHEDDSFLSKALTHYRNVALSMLGSGMSLWEVFGPDPPNVDLLFRHRTANDAPNVCNWLGSFMRGLPAIEPALKLCSVLWLTYLLRWLIVPSVENYSKVPGFLRPVSQNTNVEVVLFHMLQDAFSSTTEELTSPLSDLMGSWSKTMESSVEIDPKSGFMHATSEFEDYANDIGIRSAPQMGS